MQIGPIQLLTVGFTEPQLDGSIITALEDATDAGHIKIIDAIGVYKDTDGTILAAEATDLTDDEAMVYGAWIGALVGLGAGGIKPLGLDPMIMALAASAIFFVGGSLLSPAGPTATT